MNARASGFVTFARRIELNVAPLAIFAVEPAPLMALVNAVPYEPPVYNALITPIAPSFPIADARYERNNCHGIPKNFVTGSIATPIV